jgi:hypothetical protein
MRTTPEHLRSIQIRIETIAESESRPGETGVTLDETLAALTEPGRRRVNMLLDHIHEASHDPHKRKAVDLIRRRAARVWCENGVSCLLFVCLPLMTSLITEVHG